MICSSLLISVWHCLAVPKSINPSLGLLRVSPWRYHLCATLANVLLGDTEKNHLGAHSPEGGDDSYDALSKEQLPFQAFTVTVTYSFLNMHLDLQFESPISFWGFATIITLTFTLDFCLIVVCWFYKPLRSRVNQAFVDEGWEISLPVWSRTLPMRRMQPPFDCRLAVAMSVHQK